MYFSPKALWSEDNHGAILKIRLESEVTSKGHSEWRLFGGYNWWTLWFFAQILCGASLLAQDDNGEGHFKEQLFGPLQPSNPLYEEEVNKNEWMASDTGVL